jgi:uncharacterized membrane protein YbaN (DUF454 family)
MNTQATATFPFKLMAFAVVAALLLIWVVGLVLPLIPGVLLLVVAAVLAARYFPSIDGWLRQNRAVGRHPEWAETFYSLSLGEKVRLGAWVCAKVALDGLALVGSGIVKVANAAYAAFRRD